MATKAQQYTGRLYTQAEVDRAVREARMDEWNRLIGTTSINGEQIINQTTYNLAFDRIAELSKEDV